MEGGGREKFLTLQRIANINVQNCITPHQLHNQYLNHFLEFPHSRRPLWISDELQNKQRRRGEMEEKQNWDMCRFKSATWRCHPAPFTTKGGNARWTVWSVSLLFIRWNKQGKKGGHGGEGLLQKISTLHHPRIICLYTYNESPLIKFGLSVLFFFFL